MRALLVESSLVPSLLLFALWACYIILRMLNFVPINMPMPCCLQNVGMRQALDLVGQECELAERALDSLPQSEARSALLDLTASLRARAEHVM